MVLAISKDKVHAAIRDTFLANECRIYVNTDVGRYLLKFLRDDTFFKIMFKYLKSRVDQSSYLNSSDSINEKGRDLTRYFKSSGLQIARDVIFFETSQTK